jgi:type VI protein secretion system component VasK
MTAIAIRILIFVAIVVAVWWGARRIWRDWSGAFKAEDRARLDRDRAEREQMKRTESMITLKRDKDGKFRPED